ncbi:unnamed protein product [Paramecium pentaurelia]|uniref:Uncharacterized protein n=1 Tax=Paramecium pentaurelia TaxID=43138 RepID=A0A8S1S0W4_9CILI|nr:unnamed protein product [Paramecium pentaurelia]
MQGSFQVKQALAYILAQLKDVDEQTIGVILEILRNKKVRDCIGFLSDIENQRQSEGQISQKVGNFTPSDSEQKLSIFGNDIKLITDVLKKLNDHDFNYKDFSSEENEESTLSLIQRIKDKKRIIEFLQFLVYLTSIDETLKQQGSNSSINLRKKFFQNIKIQNTSLVGANFVKCNFTGSQFNNVDISGINLNGALLLNCKQQDLRIYELNKLHGHSNQVRSICFSPDGNTLASGGGYPYKGGDNSIRLLDVKTGQQKVKLDGHTRTVNSVFYSPDGNILASGSADNSIRLWDVKTGQEIKYSHKNYKDILAQFKIPLLIKLLFIRSLKLHHYTPYILISQILSIRSTHFERRVCQSIRVAVFQKNNQTVIKK